MPGAEEDFVSYAACRAEQKIDLESSGSQDWTYSTPPTSTSDIGYRSTTRQSSSNARQMGIAGASDIRMVVDQSFEAPEDLCSQLQACQYLP